MAKESVTGVKRKGANSNRPSKYNIKTPELRGKTQKEAKVMNSFWKEYTMDEIMTKTQEELEVIITEFMEKYQKKQIRGNPLWWYPEDPESHNRNARKTNRKSKYQADPFNPSF